MYHIRKLLTIKKFAKKLNLEKLIDKICILLKITAPLTWNITTGVYWYSFGNSKGRNSNIASKAKMLGLDY